MSNYKYKFTLFTPCYNSANFIDRIKQTLEGQTFKDFEWIVVNDASTDNTSNILKEYIKTVSFPVKFFDLEKNQMLAANWNLAVEHAEGEIFVVLGHDDIYLPHMLELYNDMYSRYNDDKIGGIIARCQTQFGKVSPKEFSKDIMTYWEYGVDKDGNYTGEAPCAWKTDVLRKYMPFDPEELINPLIGALMSCDGYSFITTNEIVRKYFVFEEGGFSLTKFSKKYTKWHYMGALRRINLFCPNYHMSSSVKRQLCIDYATAAIRYNLAFCESLSAVKRFKILITLLYPYAQLRVTMSNIEWIYQLRRKLYQKNHI